LLYALFIWALYSFSSVVFWYNNIDQISLTLPEKVWQRALNFKTLPYPHSSNRNSSYLWSHLKRHFWPNTPDSCCFLLALFSVIFLYNFYFIYRNVNRFLLVGGLFSLSYMVAGRPKPWRHGQTNRLACYIQIYVWIAIYLYTYIESDGSEN